MKPFNLKQALSGAKLVTRNGIEVSGFRKSKYKTYPYTANVQGEDFLFTAKGEFDKERADSIDLFIDDSQPDISEIRDYVHDNPELVRGWLGMDSMEQVNLQMILSMPLLSAVDVAHLISSDLHNELIYIATQKLQDK